MANVCSIDIYIGLVIKNWTIVDYAEDYITPSDKGRRKQWFCECNLCKKRFVVKQSHLVEKDKGDCCRDCARLKIRKYPDIKIGDSWNSLKIIGKSEKENHWDVQCNCGNIVSVHSGAIKRKEYNTCGKCFKNLLGEKIGRLEVIKYLGIFPISENKRANYWECLCDCGNRKILMYTQITQKLVLSCGCLRQEQASINSKNSMKYDDDISGNVYNLWTVLKKSIKNKNIQMFTCQCFCGTIRDVDKYSLVNFITNSCGCETRKNVSIAKLKNLTGMVFGHLSILELLKERSKSKSTMYKCLCNNCGSFCVVSGCNIRGCQKSCGCLTESYIATMCKKYFYENYKSISEYRIVKNPKTNYYLPFDIFIPDYNLFIEIQGQQHYVKVNWFNDDDSFEELKNRDKIKKEFAEINGKYVEIDLRKIKTSEEAIEIILKSMK